MYNDYNSTNEGNVIQPNTVQNINSNNYLNSNNKNSHKKVLLIIFLIIIGVCCGFFVYKLFTKKESSNENFDINATTSFFLQDVDSKYALFNEDGKQLTEFIYTYASSFVNGTTKVKVDDQEGIINSEGKVTVPLGKYKYITQKGGLYSVSEEKENSYNSYLINGYDKVLYNLENINIISYWGENKYLILEDEKLNKYTVINFEGKELVSFSKIDDDDIDEPTTNSTDNYISVYYNNKNWIFNVNTGKQVASFDSDKHYCVNEVSDDDSIITLNSCLSWGMSQDKTYYKFIKNDKLYDKTNECDKVYQRHGNLFCMKENDSYLLDSKLDIGIKVSDVAYNNNYGYVKNDVESFKGVNFYQDNKLIKNVSCRTLKSNGYVESDIYLLGTYYSKDCGTKSGSYDYYKSNGEKLFDKTFASADGFDSNGLAKVSEDKTNYYMIDKNGKQVGKTYSNISFWGGYYIITSNDLKGIMNKEGQEIIIPAYSKVDVSTHKERVFAVLKTDENKYIVYDLDKNKEMFKTDSYPGMNYEHYITTTSNGKTQYYTYEGKMFYGLN